MAVSERRGDTVDRGTTLKFEAAVGCDGETANEVFHVNILSGMGDRDAVDYADGVLEGVGYLYVGRAQNQLDIWETPGGLRPHTVYFLFAEGLPAPLASSSDRKSIERLKDALEFAESGMLTYTIKEREAPTSS
jgi:hypothetical protein